MNSYQVSIETTPNPEAMKFVVNQTIAAGSHAFHAATETASSPLAKKLFSFPWAKSVLIGPSFVSVVKQDWVDWDVLAEPLAQLIQEHLERGEGVIVEVAKTEAVEAVKFSNDPLTQKIIDLLNAEIRPAVAMDGGDIVFQRFEADSGRVFLHMQGACSGCPSSAFTLKEGIEVRLKEMIPEVQEVIAI
jgi:Fe-S cluster biogenesis protein NfuA